jgi:hypothetical protein
MTVPGWGLVDIGQSFQFSLELDLHSAFTVTSHYMIITMMDFTIIATGSDPTCSMYCSQSRRVSGYLLLNLIPRFCRVCSLGL